MELLVLVLVGLGSAAAALLHIESPLEGILTLAPKAPNATLCHHHLATFAAAIQNKEFWALKSE